MGNHDVRSGGLPYEYTFGGSGGGASLHKHYGEMGSVNHYVVIDILPESLKMRVVRLIAEKK